MTTLAQLAKFKDVPNWVYRAFGESGRLLYVGLTANPEQRMSGHRSSSRWWREATFIRFTRYPDRPSATAAERTAIALEDPRYNAHGRQLGRFDRQTPETAA
jgi:excinuclease UvrABC nuclease subunit